MAPKLPNLEGEKNAPKFLTNAGMKPQKAWQRGGKYNNFDRGTGGPSTPIPMVRLGVRHHISGASTISSVSVSDGVTYEDFGYAYPVL